MDRFISPTLPAYLLPPQRLALAENMNFLFINISCFNFQHFLLMFFVCIIVVGWKDFRCSDPPPFPTHLFKPDT